MKIVLTLIALALVTGCATRGSLSLDDRSGAPAKFARSFEDVSAATLESMQNLNINIKGTQRTAVGLEIEFTKSMSAWSWGEVGHVSVRALPQTEETIVIVHTAKRGKLQRTGTKQHEFAAAIFAGIREAL